jgi:hypothetical protein
MKVQRNGMLAFSQSAFKHHLIVRLNESCGRMRAVEVVEPVDGPGAVKADSDFQRAGECCEREMKVGLQSAAYFSVDGKALSGLQRYGCDRHLSLYYVSWLIQDRFELCCCCSVIAGCRWVVPEMMKLRQNTN